MLQNNCLSHLHVTQRWDKPPPGWTKINVDACLKSNPTGNGVWAVIRDDSGVFVAALSSFFRGDRDAKMAEAIGIREALSWTKRRGLRRVFIETDSQICFNAINNTCEAAGYFGAIISDCISLLRTIPESKVVFARRSANSVADSLARNASSESGRESWEHVPPPFIFDVLRDN